MIKKIFIALYICSISSFIFAQELIRPLSTNTAISNNAKGYNSKVTRALSLPFIDDFSYKGPFADATKWAIHNQVYVNNTFGVDVPSQGVATFDQLNSNGQSYYPNGNVIGFFADTLMSAAIDLSSITASDSVYMSFFVQPQGNGFRPEPTDSLSLYFLDNSNNWIKVWGQEGSTVLPFRQKMIGIQNSIFLHNAFQFRFINYASPNTNDDVWNIDYVRIDKNRSRIDTILKDLAFSKTPTSIFSKYSSMPYRHFIVDSTEKATTFSNTLKNNYTVGQTVGVNLLSTETIGNSILKTDNVNITVPVNLELGATYNAYPISFSPPNINQSFSIKHTYFYNKLNALENAHNDTIVKNNVFDQYFAYDDGSAEKEYYLLPAANVTAHTALKFHLNVADTLRGLAIRFGNQVPTAIGKKFTIVVYKDIGTSTSTEQVIYKQHFNTVQFEDGFENFTNYLLDTLLPLGPGEYYIGTSQAPNTNIDTLYFGLDVNTASNPDNFYYNVDGNWVPSTINAATMLRPLVGPTFTPTSINNAGLQSSSIKLYPNPTTENIYLLNNIHATQFVIYNLAGVKIFSGAIKNNCIDVHQLAIGNYILQLNNQKQQVVQQISFIKQ